MKLLWVQLLVAAYVSSPLVLGHEANANAAERRSGDRGASRRVKRDWMWNQMFILEEQISNLPHIVGKLSSNSANEKTKYILKGDSANTIFKVNEKTGDIYSFERLDREKKSQYELTALLIDTTTNKTVEPPSVFLIKVHDINDNAPEFTHHVFNGSVPEMSDVGTLVTTVTALDADDPTLAGNAQVTYQVITGEQYFRISSNGEIFTAVSNLDREKQSTYEIVVKARDSPGQNWGLSSTTSVIITLSDINDNFPTFTQNKFIFNAPENLRVGGEVGRMKVEDIDEPQNRNTKYSFVTRDFRDTFSVTTNALTNEGILIITKPLDFESIKEYRLSIEATDPTIDLRVWKQVKAKSITEVIINVLDVDEPPVFSKPFYQFEVVENIAPNTIIGFITARDPDAANRNIRYSIRKPNNDLITVAKTNGNIINTRALDRETNAWHNLTIAAEEIDPNNPPIKKESLVSVIIKVLDVNDNAPEFARPYEPKVCENAADGTVIINITATDKDEMGPGMKFTYYLAKKENNFTVQDNHDNTANILVKHGQFNRDVAKVHYLPIVISDNGSPEQIGTSTLTIAVCKCDENGKFTFCEEAAHRVGVAVPTLVVVFISLLLIILVVTLLIIVKRRQRKKNINILGKNVAEIHEQLVTYDEEGGGEMDTTSYDVSVLNSVRRNVAARPKHEAEPGPCLYAQVKKPSRNGEMAFMIEVKKDEADNDGDGLPYDTLHIFGYEGSESIVESLSSLESGSSDSDIDYDVLNDWGPRFKMLANLYGLEPTEESAY
ncbi:hypothetical protein FKM82_003606 [Ascaphus truei]|uniref:cadherin-5 n=1 Tax=Ascaphus truei TaxID=8439 RepID=UPI003F59CEB1